MKKQYDTKAATGQEEVNFSEFISQLPKEYQKEVEEALATVLSYIHSDVGTSTVLDEIQSLPDDKDIKRQIGISALKAMDEADPEHEWSDSAKVLAGFFAVSEICLIARESGVADIPKEEEESIFKVATQNYMHSMISSKPTQEEREQEAIRIQREVEPLMNEQQRAEGMNGARQHGIQGGVQ